MKQFRQVNIELDETGRERLLQAALGLTLGEAENVFAKIIVKDERLSGGRCERSVRREAADHPQERLAGVLCDRRKFCERRRLEVLKDWLDKRAVAFTHEARDFGLPAPKGHFDAGRAGLRQEPLRQGGFQPWQLPLLRFDMGRMFGSLVGSSEENVRRAIAVAESVAPAILWVDEIDKAFAGSQGSGATDGGTTAPRVRHLPDLALGKNRPGICRRHGQRHFAIAAGIAAQRTPG